METDRNGVSTNGVAANFMFVDRGIFWVLPLSYLNIPKSARVFLFPQSVKLVAFAAAPLVLTPFMKQQTTDKQTPTQTEQHNKRVDPICPQPRKCLSLKGVKGAVLLQGVFPWRTTVDFRNFIVFFGPRPWHIEIRHRVQTNPQLICSDLRLSN